MFSVLQNTSMVYHMEHKQKKVQNTPFGRPYKGKEVLLSKADKVSVRLSIVKIDVFPF